MDGPSMDVCFGSRGRNNVFVLAFFLVILKDEEKKFLYYIQPVGVKCLLRSLVIAMKDQCAVFVLLQLECCRTSFKELGFFHLENFGNAESAEGILPPQFWMLVYFSPLYLFCASVQLVLLQQFHCHSSLGCLKVSLLNIAVIYKGDRTTCMALPNPPAVVCC